MVIVLYKYLENLPRFLSHVRINLVLEKGTIMNYFEWSQEYNGTANEISLVIEKLKAKRKTATSSEKKELDMKIARYKLYYNECISIANHLLLRHKGVA